MNKEQKQLRIDEVIQETVQQMIESDMNVSLAAKRFHYARNSIAHRCDVIEQHTGLNPRRFKDLVKLAEMVDADLKTNEHFNYNRALFKVRDGMDIWKAMREVMREMNIDAVVKMEEA